MHKHQDDTDNDSELEYSMASLAAALADASRVKILCALMDGRAWTATELATVADISASTASAHLARLLQNRLVTCLSQGRHRYYRLTGSDVAKLLEQLMGLSGISHPSPIVRTPVSLRKARTCYDHLAGEVAVRLYDSLVKKGWLEADGSALTETGRDHFSRLGIALGDESKRKACCACLDWSERRYHVGGSVGAALLLHCQHKGWLTRTPGYREVTVTASGKLALRTLFDVITD